VAKEVVKGGIIVIASASELVEGVQKEWSTIVTEAQSELKAPSAK
jgi:hypothetical protein